MDAGNSLETGVATRRISPTRPRLAPAFVGMVLLGALLLEACADDTPTAPGDADPPAAAMGMSADGTRIVIEPHWLTLDTVGISGTLTAVVTDAEGDTIDGAEVTWESADTSIATVDAAGVVTSVEFGRTRVHGDLRLHVRLGHRGGRAAPCRPRDPGNRLRGHGG